jgi:Fe-S-cluster-containing dehydrogenase component
MESVLMINTVECVGCYACEVACKQEHNLPVGPRLIRLNQDGPRLIDGRQQLRYKLLYCIQCARPDCMEACPVGAISKRADGITVISTEKCNGCKKCVEACSYGAMQFDDIKKIACKCDLCVERLNKKQEPACVSICPSHCIHVSSAKTGSR